MGRLTYNKLLKKIREVDLSKPDIELEKALTNRWIKEIYANYNPLQTKKLGQGTPRNNKEMDSNGSSSESRENDSTS